MAKKKYVKSPDGHLCMVAEVIIDKKAELDRIQSELDTLVFERDALNQKIKEIEAEKAELESVEA